MVILRIQLLLSFLLVLGCAKKISSLDASKISMYISTTQSEVSSSDKILTLMVNITNNSSRSVNILNFPEFSTGTHTIFTVLIEKNGYRKVSPIGMLIKKRIPKSYDYTKLEPGEILRLSFDLDLSTLANDMNDVWKTNSDFGDYKFQIIFNDPYLLKNDAVKALESNIIYIKYIQ